MPRPTYYDIVSQSLQEDYEWTLMNVPLERWVGCVLLEVLSLEIELVHYQLELAELTAALADERANARAVKRARAV